MVKLWGLVPVWNNEETIYKCLEALSHFVDVIVILEGKWIGYQGSLRSTDKTMDEIWRFIFSQSIPTPCQLKLIVSIKELHQYEARNLLISEIPEGDWIIMIDSDEIVTRVSPNFRQILANTTAKGIRVSSAESPNQTPHIMDMARVFRKTKDLHYTFNHRYLDDSDGPITYGNMPTCPEFVYVHHGEHKTMRQAAEEYKHWLLKWETEEESKYRFRQ
jgi:PAS domain-containing protein